MNCEKEVFYIIFEKQVEFAYRLGYSWKILRSLRSLTKIMVSINEGPEDVYLPMAYKKSVPETFFLI